MKIKLIALFLGAVLVLAACGGEADEAKGSGETESGAVTASAEEIFQGNCSGCHGVDLSGGNAPNLTKVGSKYSQTEIEEIIHDGRGRMRGGIIDEAEAKVVAAWLAEKK